MAAAAAGVLGIATNASGQTATAASQGRASTQAETTTEIGEVVVTANRRSESVQRVPSAITAVTGDQVKAAGITDYESLVRTVPGVIATGEPGFDKLTMRGIQTSQTTSGNGSQKSVAVYLDDLPITTFSVTTTDVTPYDIERVEVLRGPQGTLFGSGSLAGAVRYITNKPDPTAYDAAIDVDGSVGRNDSYVRRFDGMVNIPLVQDKLALRVAGIYRDADGFIDNVGTGQKNSNTVKNTGARAQLLWRPTGQFSAILSGSYNHAKYGDGDLWNPALGVYKASDEFPFTTTADLETLNLTLKYDLGFADLTSSTTVARSSDHWNLDLPAIIPGVPFHIQSVASTKTVVQEARLVSKQQGRFDWVAGAFYLDQETRDQTLLYFSTPFINALNITGLPTNLAPGSTESDDDETHENREIAAFGEANYRFTDTLRLTLGLRVTDQKYTTMLTGKGFTYPTIFAAIFTGGNSSVAPTPQPAANFSTGDVVNVSPKISLSYQPNSDLNYYITAAKGFRRGSPNGALALNGGKSLVNPNDPAIIPVSAAGDELWNFEAGVKALWFDRRLKTNIALYHIEWTNMQVPLVRQSDQDPYIGNIGRATSTGVEGELEARPTHNLDVGLNFTFQQAKVASITPLQELISGALPSSKLSSPTTTFSGFVKYSWRVADSEMYIRVEGQYVGSYPNAFPNTPGTNTLSPTFASTPSYTKANLSLGWTRKNIGAVLYVDNLFDNDGVIFINPANFTYNRYESLRPRTIGLRLSWKQ